MSRQSGNIPLNIDGTDIAVTAAELNVLTGSTVTTSELNALDGYNGTTTELNLLSGYSGTTDQLDGLVGNRFENMTAGSGATSGTGQEVVHSVMTVGGLTRTDIYINMTQFNDGDTSGDVLGDDGAAANCHIGRIVTAVNGIIHMGVMTCHQAMAGGDADIDLWYADEDSLAQDTGIAAATGEIKIINSGDWSAGDIKSFDVWPAAGKYLYLVSGSQGTDQDYTAGRFVITMWGTAS